MFIKIAFAAVFYSYLNNFHVLLKFKNGGVNYMDFKKSVTPRVLSLLIIGGIFASLNLPFCAADTLTGDVDLNSTVELADLTIMKNAVLGSDVLSSQAFENADLNTDFIVNVTDETLLLRRLLGDTEDPLPSGENNIYLDDGGITFTGTGMELSDSNSVITISIPGNYNVYGSMGDGQIIVNVDKDIYAGDDDKVKLQLNGIDLTCKDNSPIYCAAISDKLIVDLTIGTTNYITDGSGYINADDSAAAIYSKDDLNIKGDGGTLIVKGNTEDGIVSKDDLKIKSGNIQVTAVDDGIRGKDSVKIEDGTVNISCSGAGIKSNNDSEEGEGNIHIIDGEINITCGVFSGSTASGKGIVGHSSVTIDGGTINIDSADDSIHSNNTVTINDGNITAATKDDGVHADEYLYINGGNINITDSYEGLEACYITINDGNIKIKSSDDGINAAGGDGSGTQGPGQGSWNPGTSTGIDYYANISGGYLFVEANGDGLDSNGNFTVSGGTVIVCGPTRGGNGIIDIGDRGAVFSVTGGLVLGIGTSDMPVAPTTDFGYLWNSGMSYSTGKMVCIADSSGNCIAALEVPDSIGNYNGACEFTSATFVQGTHNIYLGGTYSGTLDENGFSTGGTISGGTLMQSSTISGGGRW